MEFLWCDVRGLLPLGWMNLRCDYHPELQRLLAPLLWPSSCVGWNELLVIEVRLAIPMTFQSLGVRLGAANLASTANTDLMADSAWPHWFSSLQRQNPRTSSQQFRLSDPHICVKAHDLFRQILYFTAAIICLHFCAFSINTLLWEASLHYQ